MRITALLAALGVLVALAGQSHADEIDWTKVDAALGRTASVQGDVHRYGIPRSDLHVTVDDVTMKPALALGGWLGFQPAAGGAVIMGDLVLSEPEIEPVMTKLLDERDRYHCASQPPATRQPCHLLHACSRAWRSGRYGHCYPRCARREQDAF